MDGTTSDLTTSRLRLVQATPLIVAAELESAERLAEQLDALLPADWPPEHHDAETLMFWGERLSRPGAAGWWLHYVLLEHANRRTLVGTASYKGPPVDGIVEIGYSVVPSWQRRGLATEASSAMIEAAWSRGAEVVVAHTLPHLEPSIRVLQKLDSQPRSPASRACWHLLCAATSIKARLTRTTTRRPPPRQPAYFELRLLRGSDGALRG